MNLAPTPYTDVNEVIELLVSETHRVFGHKLVGLYLYGSLVTEEFDLNCSDIDLVGVLSSEIDETECAALHHMHQDFAHTHERWDERIEMPSQKKDFCLRCTGMHENGESGSRIPFSGDRKPMLS